MIGHDALVLWFALAGASLLFVALDIRTTPGAPILKWAFVILTLLTGPFAAFLYVLGCREPLKGSHEAYVATRWRQALGSTMHCAAGDGLGIIVGAAIGALWHFPAQAKLVLEYTLGFGFGWTIFQALAMKGMAGGSYLRALRQTFLPEFVSMNLLMSGMVMTMRFLMPRVDGGGDPLAGGFWFVMSMALTVGVVFAYPINWWLVARGLKRGMLTVPQAEGSPRSAAATIELQLPPPTSSRPDSPTDHTASRQVSGWTKLIVSILTVAGLGLAIAIGNRLGV